MPARILIAFFPFLLFACNETGKPKTVESAKLTNSPAFNSAAGKALAQYYDLTEKFVNWDSSAINASVAAFQKSFREFPGQDADSAEVSLVLNKADSMIAASSLIEKRHKLDELTKDFFIYLKSKDYNASPVYMNFCPMAFNDQDTGRWLSNVDSIRNPYMGLHHPLYKKAMVECGGNETKIGVN